MASSFRQLRRRIAFGLIVTGVTICSARAEPPAPTPSAVKPPTPTPPTATPQARPPRAGSAPAGSALPDFCAHEWTAEIKPDAGWLAKVGAPDLLLVLTVKPDRAEPGYVMLSVQMKNSPTEDKTLPPTPSRFDCRGGQLRSFCIVGTKAMQECGSMVGHGVDLLSTGESGEKEVKRLLMSKNQIVFDLPSLLFAAITTPDRPSSAGMFFLGDYHYGMELRTKNVQTGTKVWRWTATLTTSSKTAGTLEITVDANKPLSERMVSLEPSLAGFVF